MRIGYACQLMGQPQLALHSCIQKNATEERLWEITGHNLKVLEGIIDYNIKNEVRVFRISSDIIPFGSSPVNTQAWDKQFSDLFAAIGEKIKKADMRVSMHPGQYTVINSPNADTVARAVEDLVYHARFLDALGVDSSCKIILHIGGVYGDKVSAISRFKSAYHTLDRAVKHRLVIENDDKLYTAEDVLGIGEALDIPVVFDNLHHQINPDADNSDPYRWIARCAATWRAGDGRQKIHYSQQAAGKKPGSHSDTIEAEVFVQFTQKLPTSDIDVMLEVKDKNLSAVKCINRVTRGPAIKYLEQEWSRYKYSVLERDPKAYQDIRTLLKDKSGYPAEAFYRILEAVMRLEPGDGAAVNGLQHVWGYFKSKADAREREKFRRTLESFQQGKTSLNAVKRMLYRLAETYEEQYLLDSYYFSL